MAHNGRAPFAPRAVQALRPGCCTLRPRFAPFHPAATWTSISAMTTISRLDRLIAQLRVHLRKQGGAAAAAPPRQDGAPARQAGRQSPLQAVQALKAAGVGDEKVLIGRLVEGLLAEEFGDELANSAEFHQTIAVVVSVLAEDADAWALCRACVEEA